jgi:repressor LexA
MEIKDQNKEELKRRTSPSKSATAKSVTVKSVTAKKKPSSPPPRPLTQKEKSVLEFIEQAILGSGISPSYQEIRDYFGFSSFNSVQNYLKQLREKGYISWNQNQKRSLEVLHSAEAVRQELFSRSPQAQNSHLKPPSNLHRSENGSEEVLSLPYFGKVAAGLPLEKVESGETIPVLSSFVRDASKTFVLKVEGESMIDEGILDGDMILVQSQENAKNGDLVVATVDNESTVKRYYLRPYPYGEIKEMMVELRPSNPKMKSFWYSPEEVSIRGLVTGLIRDYK